MKTQLLEDIGQSAAVSLTPPKTAGDRKAEKAVQDLAPAGEATSRPGLGVWSRKTTWEPPRSVTRQADQQPTPLELHQVFEEIAALEAQYVPPGPQPQPQPQAQPRPRLHPEPAIAPAEPTQARPAPGVVHEPAIGPAEPTLHMRPAQDAGAPQDPLFDFSPPAPASQPMRAADPFTPAGSRPARSGKRYLLWGGCLLAGALLVQGGRWLYQERGDAAAPALGRAAAIGQQAVPLKQLDTGPDDRPAQPVVFARRPADNVPPLVMLEADRPAAAPVERPPAPVADRAEQEPAPALPQPASEATRKEPAAPAKAARTTDRSAPVRAAASAPAAGTPGQASRDSAMAATLQACRAYGYDAAQCVKRACSITRYGFACRGR